MCTSDVEGSFHFWPHCTLALTRCWSGRPNYSVGDWWPPGDCVSGPLEALSGAGSCGVGSSPMQSVDGRWTKVQTVTPQLGTVFPGLPARFFARPSWSTLASKSLGRTCHGLSTLIVQFVILLWQVVIYVKIPGWAVYIQ
jgi:hypothetical protein